MRSSSDSPEMPGGVLVVVGSSGQMSLFLTIRGDSRIAFQSNRDGFNRIYVMHPDGSGVVRLTDSEGFDPAWSADGARIAFANTTDGNPEIYVGNAEGSIASRLTHDPSHDWNPTWSPDGSKIAFESDRDGDIRVYVMNSDGTDVHRLLDTGAQACCPSWQPIPAGEMNLSPSDGPSAVEPAPTDNPPPAAEPIPFVPEPTIEGATARLDVTWPDGSAATLAYPAELDLGSGGIQPDVSYVWADDPPPRHPIVFLHGPPGVEAWMVVVIVGRELLVTGLRGFSESRRIARTPRAGAARA